MAERVADESLEGRGRYPWKEWSDGSTWRLVRGHDFNATVASVRSAGQAYANRNSLVFRSKLEDEDTILIRFYTNANGDSESVE